MKNFLSKITPRNFYWSMTGISDQSRFNVRLLYIFLSWQKCTHWVFVLEILKPFIIAHLFILLMPCFNWHSAVHIYLDVEVMLKSSTNKYLSIPGFRQLVILLIFMLKRVTDSILPRGIPLLDFGCLIGLNQYGIGISCPKEKLWWSLEVCLLWRFRNYQRTPNRMLTRRLPDTKCINASPRIRLHASIRLK